MIRSHNTWLSLFLNPLSLGYFPKSTAVFLVMYTYYTRDKRKKIVEEAKA
jgi:hypothetical protein